MNTITRGAALVAILCGPAAVLTAQQDRATDPTVSIDFKGGTLAEFLDLMRAGNERINIVASPEATQVVLPALTIKQAGVQQTLRAVAGIVANDQVVSVDMQVGQGSAPVHSVRVSLRQARPARRATEPPLRTQVFSLLFLIKRSDGIATMSADAILTAIDTGLGVAGGGDAPTVKYHPDSSLLFVRGNPQQLNIVSEVLSELRRGLLESRGSGRSAEKARQGAQKKDR